MVCDRCISKVREIVETQDLFVQGIKLGEVTLGQIPNKSQRENLKWSLEKEGFQLMDDSKHILVLKVKSLLVDLFNQPEIPEEFKLSNFLTKNMSYDYSHLSRVFSNEEGHTIERYLIKLRIEKAKELLEDKRVNVSEVAYKLGYVSAAHFSRQFKRIVGVSPSDYREVPVGRIPLDEI